MVKHGIRRFSLPNNSEFGEVTQQSFHIAQPCYIIYYVNKQISNKKR